MPSASSASRSARASPQSPRSRSPARRCRASRSAASGDGEVPWGCASPTGRWVRRPSPSMPSHSSRLSADLRWRGDYEKTQTGARGAGGRQHFFGPPTGAHATYSAVEGHHRLSAPSSPSSRGASPAVEDRDASAPQCYVVGWMNPTIAGSAQKLLNENPLPCEVLREGSQSHQVLSGMGGRRGSRNSGQHLGTTTAVQIPALLGVHQHPSLNLARTHGDPKAAAPPEVTRRALPACPARHREV